MLNPEELMVTNANVSKLLRERFFGHLQFVFFFFAGNGQS
jgi:hypothetical protein